MAWAGTEATGLSGRARGWIEDVLGQGNLSAVDGAQGIGIGPGAEQVNSAGHPVESYLKAFVSTRLDHI